MTWLFWTMSQSNGCSTPAPRSTGSTSKQWLEELAQKEKKLFAWNVECDVSLHAYA